MTPAAFQIVALACTLHLSGVPTPAQIRMVERAQGRCYAEQEACVKRKAKQAALKAHKKAHGDPGALLIGIGSDKDLATACAKEG